MDLITLKKCFMYASVHNRCNDDVSFTSCQSEMSQGYKRIIRFFFVVNVAITCHIPIVKCFYCTVSFVSNLRKTSFVATVVLLCKQMNQVQCNIRNRKRRANVSLYKKHNSQDGTRL